MEQSKHYVQYGCGLSAPTTWVNFDVSPTLRLQKVPILSQLSRRVTQVQFPANVRYGDIVKGLPGIPHGTCEGVYCSHVLEHLSLADCELALAHTFEMLKPGGTFRCVLPDLEIIANEYLLGLRSNPEVASIRFMEDTLLGQKSRPRGCYLVSRHCWEMQTTCGCGTITL